jgi:hypothetical protein
MISFIFSFAVAVNGVLVNDRKPKQVVNFIFQNGGHHGKTTLFLKSYLRLCLSIQQSYFYLQQCGTQIFIVYPNIAFGFCHMSRLVSG